MGFYACDNAKDRRQTCSEGGGAQFSSSANTCAEGQHVHMCCEKVATEGAAEK